MTEPFELEWLDSADMPDGSTLHTHLEVEWQGEDSFTLSANTYNGSSLVNPTPVRRCDYGRHYVGQLIAHFVDGDRDGDPFAYPAPIRDALDSWARHLMVHPFCSCPMHGPTSDGEQ